MKSLLSRCFRAGQPAVHTGILLVLFLACLTSPLDAEEYKKTVIDAELYQTCAVTDAGLRCWSQPDALATWGKGDFAPSFDVVSPQLDGRIETFDTSPLQGCALVRGPQGQKKVTCWLMRPGVKRIAQRDISEDSGSDRCHQRTYFYEPTAEQGRYVLPGLADPRELSVRDSQVCVNDGIRGIVCWSCGNQAGVCSFKAEDSEWTCGKSDQRTTTFTEQVTLQPRTAATTVPLSIRKALHHLTAGYRSWCALDSQGLVWCEGWAAPNGESYKSLSQDEPVAILGRKFTEGTKGLVYLATAIDGYNREVYCAVGATVACFDLVTGTYLYDGHTGELTANSPAASLVHPLMSWNEKYTCRAWMGEATCGPNQAFQVFLGDDGKHWPFRPGRIVVPAGLTFLNVPEVSPLAAIGARIRLVEPALYTHKARFLERLAKAADELPKGGEAGPSDRLFALDLLVMFLGEAKSPAVQGEILPELQSLRTAYDTQRGIHSLADIPPSPAVIRMALSTMVAALIESKAFLGNEASRAKVEAALAQAGGLLAGSEKEAPVFADGLLRDGPLLDELSTNEDTAGYGLLLRTLASYLAAQSQ